MGRIYWPLLRRRFDASATSLNPCEPIDADCSTEGYDSELGKGDDGVRGSRRDEFLHHPDEHPRVKRLMDVLLGPE
jgi:hypothetical protein